MAAGGPTQSIRSGDIYERWRMTEPCVLAPNRFDVSGRETPLLELTGIAAGGRAQG
jgi:hypothetical protein